MFSSSAALATALPFIRIIVLLESKDSRGTLRWLEIFRWSNLSSLPKKNQTRKD
jgi:hypothetical protein